MQKVNKMLSQEHFDKRMDGMMGLLTLYMNAKGEQDKAIRELRDDVDEIKENNKHLVLGDRWKLGVVACFMLALIIWGTISYKKLPHQPYVKQNDIELNDKDR
jgi:hypothetical protein